MTSIAPVVTLSPREYDAVVFDLDGVLTRTASVHAAAWKRLCDGLLEQQAADTGEAFVPFDIDADYRRSVDGKPRYDGAAFFLESRGIALPCGTPEDGPGTCTMHAMVVYGYVTDNSGVNECSIMGLFHPHRRGAHHGAESVVLPTPRGGSRPPLPPHPCRVARHATPQAPAAPRNQ
jgi:hypothetical protein